MRISKSLSVLVSIFMSVMMSNLPGIAVAETARMIPTVNVVNDITREQAEQKISEFLKRSDVRNELMKRGLSADEANQRLASLSEQEVRQLSAQMDRAQYGGDILIAILLIVLIIFLIKRI